MTKIKFCGLRRLCDIEAANEIKPEYIGFVFAKNSRRFVSYEKAKELKEKLSKDIKAVGVFTDEKEETVANLLNSGIIDIAQLHSNEDENYIKKLRSLTNKPIIKAFCVKSEEDIQEAEKSTADYVLFDSGAGSGEVFDWELIKKAKRPYFLAGGLNAENAEQAVKYLNPYALDVSSGIETKGVKDKVKMAEFAEKVRKEENL